MSDNRDDRYPDVPETGEPFDPSVSSELEAAELESDLQTDLDRARAEAAEHYDRLLRAQAELQNVLKRHERERGERVKYAGEALARDLLTVVDDLERALEHTSEIREGLAEGVELVHKGLLSVLAKHGIERIEAIGRPFDPSEHEAVATIETAESAENTVVREHRAGYRIRDRLLRPAMVAVAKAPQGGDR